MKAIMSAGMVAMLGGVGACAAPADPGAESRVLVKLVHPSSDASAIASRVAAVTALPVRYLSASSAQWHVLALRCAPAASCDAALERLRADAQTFAAVQRDERRHPLTP